MLKPSPTLSIAARANAMKAEGIDVVSLSAGEPDFETPEPVREAAIEALNAGFTKYTPTTGIRELKEAICHKLQEENAVKATPDQIVVSCGAKQSIYNAMMILLEPGDEIILIAPYWMTYAEQARLAGAVPVVIHTDASTGFVPTYDQLREKVTTKTKAIRVNSPCNPTGALFNRETIKAIAQLALRNGLWVISDEIYDRLVYGEKHTSIASLGSDIAERTITVGGCSKTYAMTGWRIGFAAAPKPVASAMGNLQDQVTSNPNSFAQKGAVKAFRLPSDQVEPMRAEFQARRDLIIQLLRAIPRLDVSVPQGAFYVLPDVSAYLKGKIQDDITLVEHLLDAAKVATVPGTVFEAPGHIRISYAASRDNIRRGIERIANALQELKA
ncbi:MAG: aspartate aminotransferase [Fimbriimonadaceae bacterium]|nr:aspartate aminotransferase [Fimbriimonadaceae bacterium]